jgi:hypothetical protein
MEANGIGLTKKKYKVKVMGLIINCQLRWNTLYN